jgi:hypothetical protein
MASKAAFAVIAVIIITVAAAGAFVILYDNEGEYDWHLGKYSAYQVSGSAGAATFDGTLKIEVTKVKGSLVTTTTTYDVYQTIGGARTPLLVKTENQTINVKTEDWNGVWQRAESIPTEWGPKTTDVYTKAESGTSRTIYVDQINPNVGYKMVDTAAGVTITYTLSDTNYLGEKVIDPDVTTVIEVTVNSTHILFSANFILYIDGIGIKSWSMGPRGSEKITYEYITKASDGNKAVLVKVVSTGGGFGTQEDSANVVVGNGVKTSITLSA